MQEEVENRTLNLVISTTRLSVHTLMDGLRLAARNIDRSVQIGKETKARVRARIKSEGPHGKQSVKQLIGHGESIKQLPVSGSHLRPFVRVLRKHGVDFAIMKSTAEDPPRYLAFFKAKDEAVLTSVLKECTAKQLDGEKREKHSLVLALEEFKKKVVPAKRKQHQKEKDLSL